MSAVSLAIAIFTSSSLFDLPVFAADALLQQATATSSAEIVQLYARMGIPWEGNGKLERKPCLRRRCRCLVGVIC